MQSPHIKELKEILNNKKGKTMNGDFKILYDLLMERSDKDAKKNDDAHKDILKKIDEHYKGYMEQPTQCANKFVSWRSISLIMTIIGAMILGSYGFTWAYGRYMLDIILKHMGG